MPERRIPHFSRRTKLLINALYRVRLRSRPVPGNAGLLVPSEAAVLSAELPLPAPTQGRGRGRWCGGGGGRRGGSRHGHPGGTIGSALVIMRNLSIVFKKLVCVSVLVGSCVVQAYPIGCNFNIKRKYGLHNSYI